MTDLSDKRKAQLCKSAMTYRTKNIELARKRERVYKINFREFQRLRNIDLF